MHVDASALTAMLLREPERDEFIDRLTLPGNKTTSAVSVLETIMAVRRALGAGTDALEAVRSLLDKAQIEIAPIDESLIDGLADTHLRYGKGSGSPARLNLGDCFSYALAKRAQVPLLYKGDDFSHTDLA